MNFSGSKARCRAKVLLRGRKNMWLGHHQRYVVPDRVPIHRRTRCHRAKPASTTSHSATTTIPYTQCGSETLKKCTLGKPQHYFPQFLAKINVFWKRMMLNIMEVLQNSENISIYFSLFIKEDLVIHLGFTYLDLSTSSFGINIGNY